MKLLCCHPSGLMYTEIYLRPLGLELVAQAALRAGHEVRILDLQVFSHKDYFKVLVQWVFLLSYCPLRG
jgi:magnesium-protoporphyrin IX monomethyl ester (oxidative) cyclase